MVGTHCGSSEKAEEIAKTTEKLPAFSHPRKSVFIRGKVFPPLPMTLCVSKVSQV
jgi:hypothetical protein